MKLENVIIGVMVVSVVILGVNFFIGDLATNYSKNADLSGFNRTNASLTEQQAIATELSDNMNFTLNSEDAGLFEMPYKFIQIGWSSIKLVFNSWSTTTSMISDSAYVMEEQGITLPKWFVPTIIAIFVVILSLMIIYYFVKWRLEI